MSRDVALPFKAVGDNDKKYFSSYCIMMMVGGTLSASWFNVTNCKIICDMPVPSLCSIILTHHIAVTANKKLPQNYCGNKLGTFVAIYNISKKELIMDVIEWWIWSEGNHWGML